MKKKFFQLIIAITLSVLCLTGVCFNAAAETPDNVPYDSYTYWDDITGSGRKAVRNRPMFEVKTAISAETLGIEKFSALMDVCTDKEGNIYLLDNESRIVVLDNKYSFVREINAVIGKEEYNFKGAKGIYVSGKGTIYICDTENSRVLCCDKNGQYLDSYVLPKSPLIPSGFDFNPIKAVTDSKGYVYILSEGSFYGALLYAPDKSFVGFYGANDVTNNILGAAQSLLKRVFPNNKKSANSQRILPDPFSDLVIDSKDFIYTTTASAEKGQIKKLEPGAGGNIIDSDSVRFTDDGMNNTYHRSGWGYPQTLYSLDVDENEFMYGLDTSFGKIFVYDSECRMITAFGGGMDSGTQTGTFSTATAIAVNGGEVLVTDRVVNTLTVFCPTDYGKKVLELTKLTIDGDYIESKQGWEEVLKIDKNLQVAYTGLARAYLAEGDYLKAMQVSLDGYDRETYSLAFEYQRKIWVSEHFTLLFAVIVLIACLIATAVIIITRKKIVLIKNEKLGLLFRTMIHPGISFEEIADKGKGSIGLSIAVLILFFVSAVIKVLWGGFIFTKFDPGTFNSLWVFVRSVGLVILWIASNWLVCTLFGGKGKLREITIVSCYSLLPIIFGRFIWIGLSNFLLPTEESFLSIVSVLAILYTALILIIGMLKIHEFTMTQFIGTSALTVVGMAAIAFLIVLVMLLFQQLGGFVATVFGELMM